MAAQNNNQKPPDPAPPGTNPQISTSPQPNTDQQDLKTGIQKFPAMPVEQNDPNLPRLKSQSPTPAAPQQQAPPPQQQSKLNILGLFFNKITLFIIVVLLFFITSSSIILAYTNYVVATPPKNIQNLIDKIITISPIPKDSLPERLKENF